MFSRLAEIIEGYWQDPVAIPTFQVHTKTKSATIDLVFDYRPVAPGLELLLQPENLRVGLPKAKCSNSYKRASTIQYQQMWLWRLWIKRSPGTL